LGEKKGSRRGKTCTEDKKVQGGRNGRCTNAAKGPTVYRAGNPTNEDEKSGKEFEANQENLRA